jgi:hypothetical protein
VAIIIDIITGLVLDFEVLSKYCHACVLQGKKTMTPIEREDWEEGHGPFCCKNFQQSSKAMEKEAALRMWRRSIAKNNMRYTQMLCDGDSVAFNAVSTAEGMYPVEKLECINHCDKRMGTALRKKAKEEKLGGRRWGALTGKVCQTLQSYYRNAVMKNLGDTAAMSKAIWASYWHCSSTDQEPHHQLCPAGNSSWCFFNAAAAKGEQPPPHKDKLGTPISQDVARAILPVYERMTNPTLLGRLTHGRTQNANECINSQIWARCPKTVFVGFERVSAAVASAVSHFNQGCSHLTQVMQQLNSSRTQLLKQYSTSKDKKRILRGDKESQPARKRMRKQNKLNKKTATGAQDRAEGPTYGAGMLADSL